jgi:hypothetical protein
LDKEGSTAHNRTVYASPPVGGSASATARSLRYAPFPRHCSGTFCQPWSLLRKALIRAGKTSQTAGTLCAIVPKILKILWENNENILTFLKKQNIIIEECMFHKIF